MYDKTKSTHEEAIKDKLRLSSTTILRMKNVYVLEQSQALRQSRIAAIIFEEK